jgi:predicted RNA polymerase sigma factor
MDSTKDDLREARDHAKSALTATLRAVRTAFDAALDAAISRLEDAPRDGMPQAGDSPRPGEARTDNGDRMP